MNRISSERDLIGLTQSDLAKKLQVSLTTVWRWENDKAEIPASKIESMRNLFGVSSDWLMGYSDDRIRITAT